MSLKLKLIILFLGFLFVLLVIADKYKFSLIDEKFDGTVYSMSILREMLQEYKTSCGRYPLTKDGLSTLLIKSENCTTYQSKLASKLSNQDLRSLKDKWGNPFLYLSEGESYRLISLGWNWIEGTDSSEIKNEKRTK